VSRHDGVRAPVCCPKRLSLPILRVRDRARGAAVSRLPDVRPKRLDEEQVRSHGASALQTPSSADPAVAAEPAALIAMAWRKESVHKLVALADVRRLTGLDPNEVLLRPDTQHLVRIDDSGRRSAFVRIPIALLVQPEGMSDLV
jgi:hypothetical protein